MARSRTTATANTTNTKLSALEILRTARKHVLMYSILRPESAVIIAFSILMTGLCLLNVFWYPSTWWVWLLLGVIGELIIILTTLKDERFLREVATDLFYTHLDTRKLRTPELRRTAGEALLCHRAIFREIVARPNAPLGEIAVGTDSWAASVYSVASGLDILVQNPDILDFLHKLVDGRLRKRSPGAMKRAAESAGPTIVIAEDGTQVFENSETRVENFRYRDLKATVLGAREQLNQSLATMYQVHRQMRSVPARHTDWSFSYQTRAVIMDQLQKLDRAGDAIDELFRSYAVDRDHVRV
jgi:hypothetical protein